MKRDYLDRVEKYMAPFLEKNGYVLLKSEFKEEDNNWYLRLFIDLSAAEAAERLKKKEEEDAGEEQVTAEQEIEELLDEIDPEREAAEEPEPGVGIEDCAKVSRYISRWLDREDFIEETYTLEVCSRGFMEDNGQES